MSNISLLMCDSRMFHGVCAMYILHVCPTVNSLHKEPVNSHFAADRPHLLADNLHLLADNLHLLADNLHLLADS